MALDLVAQHPLPKGLKSKLRTVYTALARHYRLSRKHVTVVLTDDSEIRALKKAHWGEDQATDVLTFPTWQPADPFMPAHLGDVVISLETAAQQAQHRKHDLGREVALLLSHGITHIMGYDHPESSDFGFSLENSHPDWQPFIVAAHMAYTAYDGSIGSNSAQHNDKSVNGCE